MEQQDHDFQQSLIPSQLPLKITAGSPPKLTPSSGKGRSGKHVSKVLAIFMVLALAASATALSLTLLTDNSNPSAAEVAREILAASSNVQQSSTQDDGGTDAEILAANLADTLGDAVAPLLTQPSTGLSNDVIVDSTTAGIEQGNSTGFEDFRSLGPVVANLKPAAVTISFTHTDPATNAEFTSFGSGFIYDRSGLVVTAAHVVTFVNQSTNEIADVDLAEVLVELNNGDVVEARILGMDRALDVALLEFDPQGLEFEVARIADIEEAQVGDWVIAVGSPFGLTNSVTAGVISAKDRVTRAKFDPSSNILIPTIQNDAPTNSGNSGGMLTNAQGEILGINILIQTTGNNFGDTQGNIGIGFAVPIDLIIRVIEKIQANEQFVYGSLGVTVSSQREVATGAFVEEIIADSPADRAGMLVGDRIHTFNSEKVIDIMDLISKVQLTEPGTTVTLGVTRGDQELEITPTLEQSEIESQTLLFN